MSQRPYIKKPLVLDSVDNSMHARDYQAIGVDFLYNGHPMNPIGFNAFLGDQMRLGKTNQFLLAAASAKKNGDDRFPMLIVLKPANIFQWAREIKKWYSKSNLSCFIIQSQDGFIPDGIDMYIISMDLIGRKGRCKSCGHVAERHEDCSGRCGMKVGKAKDPCDCRIFEPNGDSMVEKLLELQLKVVCVDEAHSFKNTDTARTRGLLQFLNNISQHETEQEYTFTCPWTHESEVLYEKYGLSDAATGDDVLRAMKLAALKAHPDHGGTTDTFMQYQKDQKVITDLVLSGNAKSTKITWTEKVIVQVDDRNTIKTIRKASKCPVCEAYVSMTSQAPVLERSQCGIVMMSGTAIVNNAEEYYVPLHILAPDKVPSLHRFRKDWLIQDHNTGKFSRIHPHRLETFRNFVEPYVLRREYKDVYSELPILNRNFTLVAIEDDTLKKLYNQTLDKIEEDMIKSNFTRGTSIGEIAILRQICGLAKTKFAAQMIEESIDSAPDYTKYAIGIHHHVVKDSLELAFGSPIQTLTGLDSKKEKDRIMRDFMTSPERVCAINMLAGGVGMDFWYVENVLILERQWSSAYEDQFEKRFYNPDIPMMRERMKSWLGDRWPDNENKITNVEYLVARGTIDEFFYDLVETKRDIIHQTIDNDWHVESDPATWREFMMKVVSSRL